MTAIRVLTWNLWWRFGDWRRRQDAILEVLADARPDLCGLQEVWAGPDGNQAELLARELGLQWAYSASSKPQPWRERVGDANLDVGNAVLSRWPIAAHRAVRLPAGGEPDEGRTALYARIDAPGGPLPFFTTHLNADPAHSAVRCGQVELLARFVADHDGTRGPIVTGDFNAEPDSDEMRRLGGHKTAPVVPGRVLVDTWRFADPGDPGHTWDRRNPYVAESVFPSARVDYIMVGTRVAVKEVRLVGDAPVGGVWPSDHAAVLASIVDVQL